MDNTLRQLIAVSGRNLKETVYRDSPAGMLDYRLITTDLFEWETKAPVERQRLLHKNTVAVEDFSMLTRLLPELSGLDYKKRDKMPYFTAGLENVRSAIDERRPIGIKGGPCIFSVHEVLVDVTLRDGSVQMFDYSTGKMYQHEETFSEDMSLGGFVRAHAADITGFAFRSDKPDITAQEYANLLYAFQTANAVHASLLIIPLPDMSYKKYLAAILEYVDGDMRESVMADFEKVLYHICDMFLAHIRTLGEEYPSVRYRVLHDRDREFCNFFYEKRAYYIERHRVLRALTAIPEKLEPIKDYISMQGLPFYLEGITDIIEVDSMDETDSYRKSQKAHKSAFTLSALLFPELLCEDGSTTIYNAPIQKKGYGNYGLVR